jgi:pyruvate/2-oxoglutarate/acetoin dehydrogenase E1 component
MSGGKWKVPLVIQRHHGATAGQPRSTRSRSTRGQATFPAKVVVPSTPYDARAFKSAIRDDNPVVISAQDQLQKVKARCRRSKSFLWAS